MATNADTTVTDDDKEVTEEDLRNLKYSDNDVETSNEEDETADANQDEEESEETGEDDGQTEDQTKDEETKDTTTNESSEYVKEFSNITGDTLEDYARNLEKAYQNSTTEALRLKKLVDEAKSATTDEDTVIGDTKTDEVDVSNPLNLYMKQKMDEEITNAYMEFSKHFPQVQDSAEYDKFTKEVATLSQTILQSQKRMAPPKELYSKAAVILDWEPDASVSAPSSKEKLSIALKNGAAITKTTSATKKVPTSKVTDQMISVNRLMYPGKSDDEIRKELEPYIQ